MPKSGPGALQGAALQRHNEKLQREIDALRARQTAPPKPEPPKEDPPKPAPTKDAHEHKYVLLDPRRSSRMARAYQQGYRKVCRECGELE